MLHSMRFAMGILIIAFPLPPFVASGYSLECDVMYATTIYENRLESKNDAPVYTVELIRSLISKTSGKPFFVEFYDGKIIKTKIEIVENKIFLSEEKRRGIWKNKEEIYEVNPRAIKKITLAASENDLNETVHGFIITFLGFLVFSTILAAK